MPVLEIPSFCVLINNNDISIPITPNVRAHIWTRIWTVCLSVLSAIIEMEITVYLDIC